MTCALVCLCFGAWPEPHILARLRVFVLKVWPEPHVLEGLCVHVFEAWPEPYAYSYFFS